MYSFFMHDDSDNNHGYEYMLDFQMSWVLRITAEKTIKEKNPILYERCLGLLMKLLEKSSNEDFEVLEVSVWKQWKRIDLIAHVIVKCGNNIERHLIVIENKAYTLIHDDQLNRYKHIIDQEYNNDNSLKEFKNNEHYWVITFFGYEEGGQYHDKYYELEDQCANTCWKLLSFDDMFNDNTLTGNEQFDDFWINEW